MNAWLVVKRISRPDGTEVVREVARYRDEASALIERACLERENRKPRVQYGIERAEVVFREAAL